MSTPAQPPSVGPTTLVHYVAAAAVGALVAAVLRFVWIAIDGTAPVPYGAWIVVLLLSVVVSCFWWVARRDIQVRRVPVVPKVAVMWLALAKTAGLGGAGVCGAYAAYAIAGLGRLSSERGLSRIVESLAAAAAAIVLIIAGRLLERACRVPPGKDDTPDDKNS